MDASPSHSQTRGLSAAQGTPQYTIGLIVIQSALTLALLSAATYFFGYQFNSSFYSAFGVPARMLDLPAPFHFLASYRLLSTPVVILCFVGMLPAMLAFVLATTRTEGKLRAINTATRILLMAGIPLTAFWCAFSLVQATGSHPAVILGVALLLALAILILIRPLADAQDPLRYAIASAANLSTHRPTLTLLSVTVLAVLALVLARIYARAVGEAEARSDMIAETSYLPEAILFSEDPLAIPDPTVISSPPGPTLFKYDGLRLIIFDDHRYYTFRPSEVTQARPVTYVVPDSSLRQVDLRSPATSTPTPTLFPGSSLPNTTPISTLQPTSSPTH